MHTQSSGFRSWFGIAVALLLVAPALATGSTTLCVNPGGTGGCFASIQAAVDAASGPVTIDIAAGTYLENVSISSGRVSLRGAGAGSTIVDGSASGTVLSMAFGQLTVSGVTLQNGLGTFGGGLFIGKNASAVVMDSRIAMNQASEGEGVYVHSLGSLTLFGTTLESNAAQRGGAISLGSLFELQSGRAKITGGRSTTIRRLVACRNLSDRPCSSAIGDCST